MTSKTKHTHQTGDRKAPMPSQGAIMKLVKRIKTLEDRVDRLEHNTSPHVLAGYEERVS